MIKRMQDGYAQKDDDLVVCRQRLQEVQEKATKQADRVNSRHYSMNESVVSTKKSKKINEDDEEEGSEQNAEQDPI